MPSGTGQAGDIQGPFKESDGRTYYTVGGQKSYVSPVADHTGSNPGGQDLFHHNAEWNTDTGQWDNNLDWGNIGSMIAGGALTGGALSAAAGGGEAAAGGAAGDAAAGGAGTGTGQGVMSGLLGPSMETPADAAGAGAAGAGGVAGGATTPSMTSLFGKSLPVLSQVLGSAAKSGQNANQVQNQQNLGYDQAALNAKEFAAKAPGERDHSSLIASLAGNYHPTKFSPITPGQGLKGVPVTMTGGLGEGMQNLDPGTKATLQSSIQDLLQQQQQGGANGGKIDGTPAMPPPNGSSAGDNILGGAAAGTSILGALDKSGILARLMAQGG